MCLHVSQYALVRNYNVNSPEMKDKTLNSQSH